MLETRSEHTSQHSWGRSEPVNPGAEVTSNQRTELGLEIERNTEKRREEKRKCDDERRHRESHGDGVMWCVHIHQ